MKGHLLTNIEVSRYSPKNLKSLIRLAEKVNRLDPAYPPANDESVKVGNWTGWLFGDNTVDRLVATGEGRVMGHIVLTPSHPYIKQYLKSDSQYFEVGQFFVDPEVQNLGIGKLLFTQALEIAHSFDRKLSLCVLDGSHAAQRFYRHNGLSLEGSFVGRDGLNHVFLES